MTLERTACRRRGGSGAWRRRWSSGAAGGRPGRTCRADAGARRSLIARSCASPKSKGGCHCGGQSLVYGLCVGFVVAKKNVEQSDPTKEICKAIRYDFQQKKTQVETL